MIHFLTLLSLQKSKVEDNGGFAVESTAGADSPEAAVPCARPRRLKKPVQYLEESDEDDMVWIFMKVFNLLMQIDVRTTLQQSWQLSPNNISD